MQDGAGLRPEERVDELERCRGLPSADEGEHDEDARGDDAPMRPSHLCRQAAITLPRDEQIRKAEGTAAAARGRHGREAGQLKRRVRRRFE